MGKLLKDYEKRYEKMWKDNKRSEALHKPVNDFKGHFDKLKKEFDGSYENWKEEMHVHAKELKLKTEKKRVYFTLGWFRFWKDFLHR